MRYWPKSSAVCFFALFLLFGCDKKEVPLSEIRTELDSLEQRLEWLDYRLANEKWESARTGQSDSLEYYQDLYRYLLANSKLFRNVPTTFNRLQEKSERYRFQLLLGKTLPERVEMTPRIAGLVDSLSESAENLRIDFRSQSLTTDEAKDIYCNSRNRSERELAYRALYGPGETFEKGFKDLIVMRNEEAVRLGFRNYFELICSHTSLSSSDYLSLIRHLDSLTQSPFAKISGRLRKAIGVPQLEIWDLPYAYSQINQRTDDFFSSDSLFDFVAEGLLSIGFNLKKLPVYFDEVSPENNHVETKMFAVRPPTDLRILTNSSGGFHSALSQLKETGKALYLAHIAENRRLHNFAVEEIWQEAMGEITCLLVCDSLWFNDVVNMPVGFISQFWQAKTEQELIRTRLLLMKLHFQYEAYLNPRRDLNSLYWDLLQKYTGLPRHEDIPVWTSHKELVTSPAQWQYSLPAKLIAAQSVEYMHQYFGKMTSNLNTSAFLIQNYYRFGSRYSWPELLQRGTGERLNPKYLLALLSIKMEN